MLALIVELLVCALTGAAFSFEADSFFQDEGNRPRIGQAFLVVDPGAAAGRGVYYSRVETLVTAMLTEPDMRLPGGRRFKNRRAAMLRGIDIPDDLHRTLRELAQA